MYTDFCIRNVNGWSPNLKARKVTITCGPHSESLHRQHTDTAAAAAMAPAYQVFLGAPSAKDFDKDPNSFTWKYSTLTIPTTTKPNTGPQLHIQPDSHIKSFAAASASRLRTSTLAIGTAEQIGERLSRLYLGAIFTNPDAGHGDRFGTFAV